MLSNYKNKPIRSSTIRASARGEVCTINIPGVCNHDNSTTVLCHINDGSKGMGRKPDDLSAVYGCSACHDVIDGRVHSDVCVTEMPWILYRALIRTQRRLINKGILKITGV